MLIYAKQFVSTTPPCLVKSGRLKITKIHVKFHLDLINSFSEKVLQTVGKFNECINYANLCKTMYATDPILFSSLCLYITKVCVIFHLDQATNFYEK